VNDRLPYRIRDGVRYAGESKRGKKILDQVKKRGPSQEDEGRKTAKKQKAAYMVNPQKFASMATEEEMAQEIEEDDFGTEDAHRIIQCKIR
jgi:hypothetical protein